MTGRNALLLVALLAGLGFVKADERTTVKERLDRVQDIGRRGPALARNDLEFDETAISAGMMDRIQGND